jgi:hypothetical protein
MVLTSASSAMIRQVQILYQHRGSFKKKSNRVVFYFQQAKLGCYQEDKNGIRRAVPKLYQERFLYSVLLAQCYIYHSRHPVTIAATYLGLTSPPDPNLFYFRWVDSSWRGVRTHTAPAQMFVESLSFSRACPCFGRD